MLFAVFFLLESLEWAYVVFFKASNEANPRLKWPQQYWGQPLAPQHAEHVQHAQHQMLLMQTQEKVQSLKDAKLLI